MIFVFTLALAGALALPPELELRFEHIDANGDGFISRHEAWADEPVERRFAFADRDQNGELDRAEFQEAYLSFLKP